MAKIINIARRNKKKRTTRKKRGGELNEETTNPMWKDISPASPNLDRNAVMKTLREANKLVDPRSNPVAPSDQDIIEMIGKLDAAKKEIENGNLQLSNDEKTLLYRIADLLRYTYSRRNALGIKVPSSTGGRRKKTTRKKRGGGCVNSTCSSQLNQVIVPPQNELNASQEVDYRIAGDFHIAGDKLLRFYNSKIIDELKNEHRVKFSTLRNMLLPITNDYISNNLNSFEYYQRFLEAYNYFRIQEPEVSRLFDLPNDIINLEFDNRFHDRDELINYLREKEPAIFNLLKENALNEILANVEFISQDIPNQELDGGRRKKTTRKKRGGGCVNSTCSSQLNQVIVPPPPPPPSQEVDYRITEDFYIAGGKLVRFYNSKIIDELKNEHRVKLSNLRNILLPITNDHMSNNLNEFEYYQRFLEAYNNFRIQEPEVSRLFDLPDDIINLEFDNTFHDRDELINYLREKEPAIFNLLKENALNEILARVKIIGQDIPNQELGGGRKKKTTRKKRGGGCVNSTCRSQPNEVNTNEVNTNEVNTNEVNTNYIEDGFGLHHKVFRFFFSKIKGKLKNEHRVKIANLRIRLKNIPRIRNTNNIVYYQGLNEAYNNFRIQEPELSRLFDLPDDIINLDFDNRFHDRDELINYLREKEPAIFNLLKEDALNEILANVKFISQDIPNQELDGGRRKKTTKKRKN
jgi:hypothetical protein